MTEKATEYLVPQEPSAHSIAVFGPEAVKAASEIATALSNIIKQRRLFVRLGEKDYVRIEGWQTLGALLGGIMPYEIESKRWVDEEDREFWEVIVELRDPQGRVYGRASAVCGEDEKDWSVRPKYKRDPNTGKRVKVGEEPVPSYARKSMAATRAASKVYRAVFGWVMSLAGYEPTPAEEMIGFFGGNEEVVEAEYREAERTRDAQPSAPSRKQDAGGYQGNLFSPDDAVFQDIEAWKSWFHEVVRYYHRQAQSQSLFKSDKSLGNARKLLARVLNEVLEVEFGKAKDDARHAFIRWATNGKASSVKDLGPHTVKAFLTCLEVENWQVSERAGEVVRSVARFLAQDPVEEAHEEPREPEDVLGFIANAFVRRQKVFQHLVDEKIEDLKVAAKSVGVDGDWLYQKVSETLGIPEGEGDATYLWGALYDWLSPVIDPDTGSWTVGQPEVEELLALRRYFVEHMEG